MTIRFIYNKYIYYKEHDRMKRMKLEKKNILKATIAFAVALAFIMPGVASVADDEITISGVD